MKIGVLVMAHGTPSSPDGIEAFYTRIRRGHPPTPELLEDLTRRYLAIGGVSPLTERTAAQVAGITAALERDAPGVFDVRFGSKFEPPMLEEPAAAFRDEGFDKVIGIVLAPHSSTMSTEQYMSRARETLGPNVEFIAIGAWYDAPGFLELIARRVNDALATIPGVATRDDRRDLQRALTPPARRRHRRHLPRAAARERDARRRDCGRAAHSTSRGSRPVAPPIPWLGPDILVALREKRENGFTDVVSCPIGFVSDHLEVLFDIDLEAQGVAREIGLNLVRTASLNDDPVFTTILANVIRQAAA